MQKPWLTYYQDIAQICSPLYENSIDYFGHAYIQSDGHFFVLATNPGFTEFHLSEQKLPPSGLINFTQLQTSSFFLNHEDDDALGFTNGTVKVLHEQLNLVNPLLCIQKHESFAELFLFSLNMPNAYKMYAQNPDFFLKFIFYYKAKGKDLIDKAKILMPKAALPNNSIENKFSLELLTNKMIVTDYWITTNTNEVKLKKSEYDVLEYIGRGLQVKEIAAVINKPIGTIRNIIYDIKKKTDLSRDTDLRKLYWKNHIVKF